MLSRTVQPIPSPLVIIIILCVIEEVKFNYVALIVCGYGFAINIKSKHRLFQCVAAGPGGGSS